MDKLQMDKLKHEYEEANRYYKGVYSVKDLGIAIPRHLSSLQISVGWAKIGVDKFCDRIIPIRFDKKSLLKNLRKTVNEAVENAVIYGIGYLVVYEDRDQWRVRVGHPFFSFADLNPLTREVDIYYEYTKNESQFLVSAEGMCLYTSGDLVVQRGMHVFPIVHKQTAIDIFGQSRITRPVRDLIDSAVRALGRSDISAEFYSFPQAVLLGADIDYLSDEEVKENVKGFVAGIGRMLALPANEETGVVPELRQLVQQSFAPYSEHIGQLARLCAAELNIDAKELGIYETNPTSAEALYASKEDIVLECTDFEDDNETAILGAINALIEGNKLDTEPELVWAPPATPSPASKADAFSKLVTAIPALALCKSGLRLAGLDERTVDEIAGELYGD